MRYLKIILCILIFVFLIIWIFSLISKTPKGIDTNPLFSLKIDNNINLISILQKDSSLKTKYEYSINHKMDLTKQEYGHYMDWISLSSTNDTIKGIFRGIEIFQFSVSKEAVQEYLDYRKTFSSDAAARIYREKIADVNRYFVIYKTIRFDYNHGLPYKIDNEPELILGFLINKYFISISYTKYSSSRKISNTYVNDMNNDIIQVVNFINELMQLQKKNNYNR